MGHDGQERYLIRNPIGLRFVRTGLPGEGLKSWDE